MNDLRHRKPRPLFTQEPCTECPFILARQEENDQAVKKTTAVLKKAMTEKNERWKSREWYGSTKTWWQQPAGSSGRQRSVDAWEHAKPRGKWIEVSADYRVLDALMKEKNSTWTKSGRESARREADLCGMLEKAATDEKSEERDRDKLGDTLEAFLKRKEEEDEATGLMKEMTKNVVAAQRTCFEAKQSLCNALREYVEGYDRDQGRARTPMTQCWQSIQSRDTKNMNLEKDLEDMHCTAKRVGWCEEEKTTKLWKQIEGDEQ